MTDVDHFYLPRREQEELAELLHPNTNAPAHIWAASVPALIDDLAIAITRQDRFGNGMRVRSGSDEQPLPVNLHAVEAADNLRDELASWVRLVTEQRHLTYQGGDTTLELARWLKRWILALAMSEGAETALTSIRGAVRTARRAIDRPLERPTPEPNQNELAEADRMVLNASAAARLAKSVGYHDLTVRRIKYLRESGRITPVHTAGRNVVFLFGDIRRAHQQCVEDEQPVAS